MTTEAEKEFSIKQTAKFLEFLAGYSKEYSGEIMLHRKSLRVPRAIAREAQRRLRHFPA